MAKSKKVGNPAIVDTQRQGMTSVARDGSWMAGNQNGRQVAGTGYAYSKIDDPSAKDFSFGLTARKGPRGAAPRPTAAHRAPVMQDRLGPRFAITAKMPGPQSPEAGLTQRNTIFMRSVVNRSAPNFNLGRMG